MGCDNVCLDMYCEIDNEIDNEFYAETTPTARVAHVCCECRRTIAPGEQYERATGKSEGQIWTASSCADCREIRKALVCGSWIFGQLWQEIEEVIFPEWDRIGPFDCLAKIDSLPAREKLRAAYADWKADRR